MIFHPSRPQEGAPRLPDVYSRKFTLRSVAYTPAEALENWIQWHKDEHCRDVSIDQRVYSHGTPTVGIRDAKAWRFADVATLFFSRRKNGGDDPVFSRSRHSTTRRDGTSGWFDVTSSRFYERLACRRTCVRDGSNRRNPSQRVETINRYARPAFRVHVALPDVRLIDVHRG